MRALVTGGAGFIGSHLVSRLISEGYEVVVLDSFLRGNKLPKETIRAIELVEGDVRDETTVRRLTSGCDLIFHFAAVLGVDIVADNPVETMQTEVLGLSNITKAAVASGVPKIVYASTSGVYGKAAIERSVDEEYAVAPSSSYAIAKRYSEIYLAALYQEKGLESVSLRFFNVYGPRQDSRMVIPRFFEQAMSGQPITVYGDGRQTRDFTYIDDVVEATFRVANQVTGCQIVNVSNNSEYSIASLGQAIAELTGTSSPVGLVDAPSGRYDFEVERRCGSSEKLQRLTGFSPSTPLREGLQKVYDYLLSH